MSDKKVNVCPWCGNVVENNEPKAKKLDGVYHLACAAEEEDDAFFDRDMEFGDQ